MIVATDRKAPEVMPDRHEPTINEVVDPRIERTRRVVLHGAVDELGDLGFGAFTIESVAARSGVAKSTIYRHWPDKHALIADAFETFHDQIVPRELDGSVADQLAVLLGHVAEIVVDSTFSACIPALIEGAERDPRLRAFHHEYSATRRASLARLITQGVADGELDAATDPELATVALLAPLFYQRLFSAKPFEPERSRDLVDAVLSPAKLRPIGRVSSPLTDLARAPHQGDEDAPDAWIVLDEATAIAAQDLTVGQEIVVLTWLHRAHRDVLATHPRGDRRMRLRGVFSTRSPDRPNPIGLHQATILANEGVRLRVSGLEAIDGTPVLDLKPILEPLGHR